MIGEINKVDDLLKIVSKLIYIYIYIYIYIKIDL